MDNKEKFISIISPLAGGLMVVFIGIIFGVTMAVYGLIVTILLWILFYRFLIVIPRQKENKSQFFIKQYASPSYGQAKEIGIFIQNVGKDEEDAFPKIRIIGDVEQVEYENGKIEKTNHLLPTADNRIFPGDDYKKIEFNIPKNIVLAKIEKKNIFIPLEKNFLLGSFWEIGNKNHKFTRTKWKFTFEIFGKKGNDLRKFKNEMYRISFEAYERQGDVFLEFEELKKIFE